MAVYVELMIQAESGNLWYFRFPEKFLDRELQNVKRNKGRVLRIRLLPQGAKL